MEFGSNLKETMEAQNLINQVQAAGQPTNKMVATQPQCPQCDGFHPALSPGQKCPLAEPITEEGEKIDTSGFILKLRDMTISQLEQKGIKDYEKFFNYIVDEVMKAMEGYSEQEKPAKTDG